MASLIFYTDEEHQNSVSLPVSYGGDISFPVGGGPQEIEHDGKTYGIISGVFSSKIIDFPGYVSTDISSYSVLYGDVITLVNINGTVRINVFGTNVGDCSANGIVIVNGMYEGKSYICIGNVAGTQYEPYLSIKGAVSEDAVIDYEQDSENPYGDDSKGTNDSWGHARGGTGERDFSSSENPLSIKATGNILPIYYGSGGGFHVYFIDSDAFIGVSKQLWNNEGRLWTRWENLRCNPISGVVACFLMPPSITYTLVSQGLQTFTDVSLAGTTIRPGGVVKGLNVLSSLIVEKEVGSYDIPGLIDAVDYNDTHIVVYLPYCGEVEIDPNYCIGGLGEDGVERKGNITVIYRSDITTGNVCAFVVCTDRNGNKHVAATATGNAAVQVPLSGHNDGSFAALGSLIGATTAALTGNFAGAANGFMNVAFPQKTTTMTNSVTGNIGILENANVLVTISYPLISDPKNYDNTKARPSDIGGTLNDFSGFTVVDSINLDSVSKATSNQKAEIEALLKEGVYV